MATVTDALKSLNIDADKNIEEYEFNELALSTYRDSISNEMNINITTLLKSL